MDVRFVGVPRGVVNEAISEMPGWRALGYRMLERARETCPVSSSEDHPGGALRDSLEVRHITGADPRLLLGTSKLGEVLGYVTSGTDPHEIVPVNAKALRFTSHGTVIFSTHVDHPGTAPNPFLLNAARAVAHEAGSVVA